MTTKDDLDRRVAEVAGDRLRGASELAREAISILEAAAQQGQLDRIPELAAALAASRPAMAAIKNVVSRVTDDPGAFASPQAAVNACRHVREWLDYSTDVVVGHAATIMPEGAVIVTCSYSSAVVRACERASRDRRIQVRCLESRVGDTAYGERAAAALRERGVDATVVADEGIADALLGATLVLVGADRVLPTGSLVNGTPSLELAQLASGVPGRQVPFYAACEAFKLDAERRLEPGFDLVPAGLITGYVTEKGIVAPAEVWAAQYRA